MHAKAGNKRQLTWSVGDALFFSSPLPAFVWHSPVLLASFSFLLPVFFSSLSLLLCSAFLFLKAGAETDEDDRCWSFCAQPMVAASRDSEIDRPRRFWSLFVFSPSADAFSLDDEDDGDESVLCWWSCRPCLCVFPCFRQYPSYGSLPCLSLVSSCLSFLVFLCSLLFFLSFSFQCRLLVSKKSLLSFPLFCLRPPLLCSFFSAFFYCYLSALFLPPFMLFLCAFFPLL